MKCQFAHGKDELRPVLRHPKYKTEICRTFHSTGTCPYGKRCRFIHTSADEGNQHAINIIPYSKSGGAGSPEEELVVGLEGLRIAEDPAVAPTAGSPPPSSPPSIGSSPAASGLVHPSTSSTSTSTSTTTTTTTTTTVVVKTGGLVEAPASSVPTTSSAPAPSKTQKSQKSGGGWKEEKPKKASKRRLPFFAILSADPSSTGVH